jgi:hypothetical protein
MGKPLVSKSRLIRLEVRSADQAAIIMKSKKHLRSNDRWSDIYISQMRSNMAGKFEGRMNSFHRINKESIAMKKYNDCILFTETGTRVPMHKFAADKIQVGSQTYAVPARITALRQDHRATSFLGTLCSDQINSTQPKEASAKITKLQKKLKQIKPRAKPLKGGGTRVTRSRDKPYSMSNEQTEVVEDLDGVESEFTESQPRSSKTRNYLKCPRQNMDTTETACLNLGPANDY